jgi:hypothetical protein
MDDMQRNEYMRAKGLFNPRSMIGNLQKLILNLVQHSSKPILPNLSKQTYPYHSF